MRHRSAEAGHRTFTLISALHDVNEKMERLFRKLEQPQITDIVVESPSGTMPETYPQTIPDLYAGEPIVIKHRYSPFVGTNIEYLLRATGRRSLLVTGVVTNVCGEAVLRDGFAHDYHVVLIEDCAAAYSAEAHRATVDNVRDFLGRVVESGRVRACWQGAASAGPP